MVSTMIIICWILLNELARWFSRSARRLGDVVLIMTLKRYIIVRLKNRNINNYYRPRRPDEWVKLYNILLLYVYDDAVVKGTRSAHIEVTNVLWVQSSILLFLLLLIRRNIICWNRSSSIHFFYFYFFFFFIMALVWACKYFQRKRKSDEKTHGSFEEGFNL